MSLWDLSYHDDVETDIRSIIDYIAEENVVAAGRFQVSVRTTLEATLFMPQAHQPHPYYRRWFADLRHVTVDEFEKYGIFYVANQSDRIVHVIAVVHGSRHLRNLLRSRKW